MSNKTKTNEINIKFGGFIGLLVYIGIGFICHLIFIGTNIVWSDAFSLFIITLWPFYLFYLVLFWGLIACAVIFLIVIIYDFFAR